MCILLEMQENAVHSNNDSSDYIDERGIWWNGQSSTDPVPLEEANEVIANSAMSLINSFNCNLVSACNFVDHATQQESICKDDGDQIIQIKLSKLKELEMMVDHLESLSHLLVEIAERDAKSLELIESILHGLLERNRTMQRLLVASPETM